MAEGVDRAAGAEPPALRAWLLTGLVAVAVLVVDQVTKHAIEHSVVRGEEQRFLPGVQLVNTRNQGVAFGFLPGKHLWVTILIALALVVLLVYFARHATRPLIWLPTGLLLGGRSATSSTVSATAT